MTIVDFILNLAGLSLWLSWRLRGFDPLIKTSAASLAGTLRRAAPNPFRAWQTVAGLLVILWLRAVLYWQLGPSIDWTPKMDLGLILLAFRNHSFWHALTFSVLSFGRTLLVFYFWLLVLLVVNWKIPDEDAFQKMVRLQWGRAARWPRPVLTGLSIVLVIGLWAGLNPFLARMDIMEKTKTAMHLLEQGGILWLGLVISLKYLLPLILLAYLISSYIFLGDHPFWGFIAATGLNLLRPLGGLPIRGAKLDLTPLLGILLIFVLLQMGPNFALGRPTRFLFWNITLTNHHVLWPE
jgi:uncharacterized protein YggT (Ycf19 family)